MLSRLAIREREIERLRGKRIVCFKVSGENGPSGAYLTRDKWVFYYASLSREGVLVVLL
jgi:hypothetical protein